MQKAKGKRNKAGGTGRGEREEVSRGSRAAKESQGKHATHGTGHGRTSEAV